jgi:hypothetical protein
MYDTDQDGMSDGEEVSLGTDPLDGGVTESREYGCATRRVHAQMFPQLMICFSLIFFGVRRRQSRQLI